MQSQRIDDIARASANEATRRHVLRAISAAIISGIAFRLRVSSSLAQAPMTCVQDSDCLDDDADPCTGATCDGGTCTFFIATCIPGYSCCGNGECCPAVSTCQSDADCVIDDPDPCAGSTCQDGTCTPYLLTCAEGLICCRGSCTESCEPGVVFDPHCGYERSPDPSIPCGEEAAGDSSAVVPGS